MSRDRRGMAVLMDAMLFLAVLTVLSACIMMPDASVTDEGQREMVNEYHSVMLCGEVPGGDGSAMSQTSLSAFIILTTQDGSGLTVQELRRIELAVSGTLQELEGMGQSAWWTLNVGGEEHVFGQRCVDEGVSLYVDRQVLNEGPSVSCALTIAA